MAQTHRYDGSTLLTTVKDQTVELQECANAGQVGGGRLVIEDTAGTLTIVGHKAFKVTQSASSDSTVFRGFVTDREYARGDNDRLSTSRHITLSVADLNAKLGFKVIRGSAWRKRPRHETVGERMTALLASSFMSGIHDYGYVDYPATELDGGEDLRGQFPGDVIADMAERVGYNWFLYYDDSADAIGLWFQDSNTSTDWSSTLKISDVDADVDDSTIFAPSFDTKLARSPARTVSGVWEPFDKGNVYRTRAATEDTYEPRDGVAPNANVKRRAKARTLADGYLFTHRNEEDQITTTLYQVPSNKVNHIRAGMRIQAKFTSFTNEGYGDYTWFRVLETTKKTLVPAADWYDIDLLLSPQEETPTGTCTTAAADVARIQHKLVNHPGVTTVTFDTAPTVGNLLLLAVGHRDEIGVGPLPSFIAGWTQVPQEGPDAYVYADPTGGGVGHADLWWRVCQTGDTGVDVGSDCMKILMEFTPVCSSPIDAAKDDSSGNNSASISQTSGTPGVPALVVGAFTTRQTDTGTFSAAVGTNRVPPTGDYPIAAGVGHDRLLVLWKVSTAGAAVTLAGTQAGGTIGGYWWGGRIAAFEVME